MMSVIGTLFFYGYGLGFYGMGRAWQLVWCVAVFAVLLLLAHLWLSRFRYGPVEWLWRAFTYLRVPPMRPGASCSRRDVRCDHAKKKRPACAGRFRIAMQSIGSVDADRRSTPRDGVVLRRTRAVEVRRRLQRVRHAPAGRFVLEVKYTVSARYQMRCAASRPMPVTPVSPLQTSCEGV